MKETNYTYDVYLHSYSVRLGHDLSSLRLATGEGQGYTIICFSALITAVRN